MKLDQNRLIKTFADLRSAGKKTLLPFVTAGYPDLETTETLLQDFAARGVRVCELGIPYSDPMADGPVIQASYTEALAKGIHSHQIFEMVKRFRSSQSEIRGSTMLAAGNLKSEIALLAMVSYSIVFRHGVAAYIQDAAAAGFDGLIIPDLPLEEAQQVEALAAQAGLALVLLVAPTTPADRRLEIARRSRGFIYYISVSGITGQRDRLPQSTIDGVVELRHHVQTPVCVGFGIAKPETVRTVCQVADGAIVGSAIVSRITEATRKGLPRPQLVQQVGQFVAELMAPLQE